MNPFRSFAFVSLNAPNGSANESNVASKTWTDCMRRLPGTPERMRFSVKNDLVEIQCPRRREEQVEIFECLGQNEALHFIAFLFGDDVGERGVAGVSAAVFYEIVQEFLAHLPILRIAGEVIQII